jgi:uncharacterized OB-fold protein
MLETGSPILCRLCHGRDFRPHEVPGVGRLVSWTLIRRPPRRFAADAPIPIAIVDLEAGLRVTGRLRHADDTLELGAPVFCCDRQDEIPVFERMIP